MATPSSSPERPRLNDAGSPGPNTLLPLSQKPGGQSIGRRYRCMPDRLRKLADGHRGTVSARDIVTDHRDETGTIESMNQKSAEMS